MYIIRVLLCLLFSASTIAHGIHPKYAQFCQQTITNSPLPYAAFCVSISAYDNPSTLQQDLYVVIQLTRHHAVSRGWTAVGPGQAMDGALMFIVYGDPASGKKPIVSVRTTKDHMPPQLITLADAGGADFDLINGAWASSGNGATASVDILFTNCTRWPGTTIDPFSKSQPWIWAQNADQRFSVYSFNTDLESHAHDSSGHGIFYMDMDRTVMSGSTEPSFPPVLNYKGLVGTSKVPHRPSVILHFMSSGHAWALHGVFMGLAFLVLFPIGVVALRSDSTRSFQLHWILQLAGTLSTILGALIALLLHPQIIHLHQIIGIFMVIFLTIQGLLGWKHHLVFVRTGRRGTITTMHMWLGRSMMTLGPINVISGLILRDISKPSLLVLSLAMCMEIAGVSRYVHNARIRVTLNEGSQMADIERVIGKDVYRPAYVVSDDEEDDPSVISEVSDKVKDDVS